MIERKVQVHPLYETGQAAMLVQTASKFNSRISLVHEEKTANAKSIMGIISLNITGGKVVNIIVDGDDEQQALPTLEQFLSKAGS